MLKLTPFFLIILLLSCTSKPDANKKFHCKLNLHVGDTFEMTNESQNTSTVEVKGKKETTIHSSNSNLLYAVINDSAGFKQIKVTYKALTINIKKGDKEQYFSMDDTTANNMGKLLYKLKNKTVYITLNPQNNIVAITSFRELFDSLYATINMGNAANKQNIQQQLTSFLGEDMVKTNFENAFKILPDSAINIGFKWQKQNNIKMPIPLQLITNYELENIKNNKALVSAMSNIDLNNSQISLMGTQVNTNLKGKQEKEYEIDLKNGLMTLMTDKTKLKGNVLALGREIPVEIESKTKIEIKKIP